MQAGPIPRRHAGAIPQVEPHFYNCSRLSKLVSGTLHILVHTTAPAESMSSPRALNSTNSQRSIVHQFPARMAVLDMRGVIVEASDRWLRFGGHGGGPLFDAGEGTDFLAACRAAVRRGFAEAGRIEAALGHILEGRTTRFQVEYPSHGDAMRWYQLTVSALDPDAGFIAIHEEITEHRLVEDALREKTYLLHSAQRVAGLGYWHMEPGALSMMLSEEASDILGIPWRDSGVPMEQYLDRVPEAARDGVATAISRVLVGQPLDLQHQVEGARGERWLRIRAELSLSGPEGKPRVYGTIMDITEKRAAGEALRESEIRYKVSAEELKTILDSSMDLICTLDAKGQVTRASAAATRILGYEPGELEGRNLWQMVLDLDEQRTAKAHTRARMGRDVASLRCRFVRKDGTVAHCDCSLRWSSEDATMYCVARDNTEAVLIAEANRVLSERLHATLENMVDGFLTVNRELRVTYVNQTVQKAVGMDAELMVGRLLTDIFPDAASENFFVHYRRALVEGVPAEFEEYHAGIGAWVGTRVFPTRDGLSIFFRDETERHTAQQALRESEERFKHVADALADATWDFDVQANRTWCSASMARVLGVRPESPDQWLAVIHPEDRGRMRESTLKALDAGVVRWREKYRVIRPDGSCAHVVDCGYVIRDTAGNAVRVVGGINDITEQLLAQDRLREQGELLDRARDAIAVVDAQSRVLYWNQGSERLYGWTGREAQGARIERLTRCETSVFGAAWTAVLQDGDWSGELVKSDRRGEPIVVESRWTLLRSASGEPQRVLMMDSDVTERRELERQLMHVQRMETVGALAGGIAHDLNNVLTPILMSANLLRVTERGAEADELIDAIAESARRGANMVSRLLSSARGADGSNEPFDLIRVIREVEKLARETFPRSIGIVTEIEQPVGTLLGDATQIHQVLLNLCINARDAMPEGGTLRITASHETGGKAVLGGHATQESVVLVVADTGTGMSSEVLDRIFDPFFTTKGVGKGTGLGLPTSLAIVRRHGGIISVNSRVDVGTKFTIKLPAAPGMSASVAPAITADPAPQGDGRAVLLVDDEAPILDIVARMLRDNGYRVLTAANGADAVSLYGELADTIDLVVMDMTMPVMDGLAAIGALRKFNPSVRVVATSGICDDAHVTRAMAAGAATFLPKPYSSDSMLRELARVIDNGS
ncbi:MAG TPA: PAS domain S-box protein [Usitatibacter sp.]|jgi:PAS domain S-box-containing protein|nr:PAS domain S-box protein [Usitatibacter sp.]